VTDPPDELQLASKAAAPRTAKSDLFMAGVFCPKTFRARIVSSLKSWSTDGNANPSERVALVEQ
jgi:hypothetical protein